MRFESLGNLICWYLKDLRKVFKLFPDVQDFQNLCVRIDTGWMQRLVEHYQKEVAALKTGTRFGKISAFKRNYRGIVLR